MAERFLLAMGKLIAVSQIKSLKEYGCEKIFFEKKSGTTTKGRIAQRRGTESKPLASESRDIESGAIAPHVDHFFESLGVELLVGYGLTETSPVVSC